MSALGATQGVAFSVGAMATSISEALSMHHVAKTYDRNLDLDERRKTEQTEERKQAGDYSVELLSCPEGIGIESLLPLKLSS